MRSVLSSPGRVESSSRILIPHAHISREELQPHRKKCLAMVFGITICRPYLYGQNFKFVTNQNSLRWLLEISDPTSGRLMRWSLRLAEYGFDIEYKKGSLIVQPDALSRLPSIGNTTEREDLEISCLSVDLNFPEEPPVLVNTHTSNPVDAEAEVDPTFPATGLDAPREPLLPISTTELLHAQDEYEFCQQLARDIVAQKTSLSAQDKKTQLMVRTRHINPQVVVPTALTSRLQNLTHTPPLSAHSGRKLMCMHLKEIFIGLPWKQTVTLRRMTAWRV
eukprot:IDg12705t1